MRWIIVQGMAMPPGYEPHGKWDLTNAEAPAWIAICLDDRGDIVAIKDLL